ncbi:condensation domain-containing protein [Streptomyces sp. NPDC005840]|uniref:condensation domain-containing protein n=1 Tax=Streptomyces sp. NPDC005840 TaxID=3157072 RepID=UPI0033FAFF9A
MVQREDLLTPDNDVVAPPREGARAPLMWSQEMYWYAYHLPLPVVDSAKIQLTVPLPDPGLAEDVVLDAVRRLMTRHEALRTLYPTDPTGTPYQLVVDRFDDPVPLRRRGNEPEDVEAVFHDLFLSPMDQATELPVRVGCTLNGERVATLVLLLNHISADAASLPLLRADLKRYLGLPDGQPPTAPEPAGATTTQPASVARQQRSGTRDSAQLKALRYCRGVLESAPGVQFPRFRTVSVVDPANGIESHYRRVSLQSSQLFAAFRRMREGTDFSVPAQISAAFTMAVAALSGNPRTVVKMNLSNRFREVRDSVGCFFQEALVSVDPLPGATVHELMAATKKRIFVGARHAQYSYLAFRDLKAEVESERGRTVRLGTILNCSDQFATRLANPNVPEGTPEIRPRLLKNLECLWRDEYTDLCLKSFAADGEVVLDLVAHRSVIEQDEIERMLVGMERFLIALSEEPHLADATVAEVVERFGFPVASYGEEWVHVDHSWVDTAKLARVIRSVAGVGAASVGLVQRPSGEPALVARLVADPSIRAEVEAHVLAVAREELDVMCPHAYVWCDALPDADASPPAEEGEPAGTGTPAEAGSGSDRPGAEARDRAFAAAVSLALRGAPVDLDSCYVRQGGTAVMAPAVVRRLDRLGYTGPTPDDLLGPWPLRVVAGLCVPDRDKTAG